MSLIASGRPSGPDSHVSPRAKVALVTLGSFGGSGGPGGLGDPGSPGCFDVPGHLLKFLDALASLAFKLSVSK